ncbi:unnamed protein product, partial [Hapterophycus canaliculatus]
GAFDQRCDIYSLGLVMHDLLSGAPPLPVDTIDESPRRLPFGRRAKSVIGSKRMVALLQRALADDPNKRFSDASEFAGCLRAVAVKPLSRSRTQVFIAGALSGAAMTMIGLATTGKLSGSNQRTVEIASTPRIVDELHSLVTQARTNRVLETE